MPFMGHVLATARALTWNAYLKKLMTLNNLPCLPNRKVPRTSFPTECLWRVEDGLPQQALPGNDTRDVFSRLPLPELDCVRAQVDGVTPQLEESLAQKNVDLLTGGCAYAKVSFPLLR
jgi:hypothetical protein